jgi:hypothetical protein
MGLRGHPSLPFLAAAIAALLLYRGMLSLGGLDHRAIFVLSVTCAAALTAIWLAAQFLWPLRKQ